MVTIELKEDDSNGTGSGRYICYRLQGSRVSASFMHTGTKERVHSGRAIALWKKFGLSGMGIEWEGDTPHLILCSLPFAWRNTPFASYMETGILEGIESLRLFACGCHTVDHGNMIHCKQHEAINRIEKCQFGGRVPGDFANADLRGLSLNSRRTYTLEAPGADLSGAWLWAGFKDSNFRGAIMRNAHLGHARFEGCDLRNVDFTGADLYGCESLAKTQLAGAIIAPGVRYEEFLEYARALTQPWKEHGGLERFEFEWPAASIATWLGRLSIRLWTDGLLWP